VKISQTTEKHVAVVAGDSDKQRSKMSKMSKPHIRQNIYGNWYGYIGTRKAEWFYNTPEETSEEMAKRWLAKQRREAIKQSMRESEIVIE
jgi:hypothetical protein